MFSWFPNLFNGNTFNNNTSQNPEPNHNKIIFHHPDNFQLQNKVIPDNYIGDPFYSKISKMNYLIGGSYALKTFMTTLKKPQSWEPNDIDIFTFYKKFDTSNHQITANEIKQNFDEWSSLIDKTNEINESKTSQVKINTNRFFDWDKFSNCPEFKSHNFDGSEYNVDDSLTEDFDKAIVAVATYNPAITHGKTVQVVLLEPRIYDEIAPKDLSHKINYHDQNRYYNTNILYTVLKNITDVHVFYRGPVENRDWYVPKSEMNMIVNGILPGNLCTKRIGKYIDYGFTIKKE
jgi:hypothetical protein